MFPHTDTSTVYSNSPTAIRDARRYREDWVLNKPDILKSNKWEGSFSEVLISTPRRFGKTFAVAIFVAVIALSVPLEVVVFSPARRASRKLLERVYEVSHLRRLYTSPLKLVCSKLLVATESFGSIEASPS